ncbi:MAG: hypothetical protein JKX92_04930 [Porticoccaceae bacterium]|nr:hypothetical protein [Porticoccaceae bacterium]
MLYFLWLVLGLIAAAPLLWFVNKLSNNLAHLVLGVSLVVAAILYLVFALVMGDLTWVFIEVVGLPIYGFFYWLSYRYSIVWLSVGWFLHPVWDVLLHLCGPGNEVVPAWYSVACVSFDIALGVYILYRFRRIPENA